MLWKADSFTAFEQNASYFASRPVQGAPHDPACLDVHNIGLQFVFVVTLTGLVMLGRPAINNLLAFCSFDRNTDDDI